MEFLDINQLRRVELLKREKLVKGISASSQLFQTQTDEPNPTTDTDSAPVQSYLTIFRPDVESYVITNKNHKKPDESVYYVRLTRNFIDYRVKAPNGEIKLYYDVNQDKLLKNDQPTDMAFKGKFFAKIGHIATAIDEKKVVLFEEPRKGGV